MKGHYDFYFKTKDDKDIIMSSPIQREGRIYFRDDSKIYGYFSDKLKGFNFMNQIIEDIPEKHLKESIKIYSEIYDNNDRKKSFWNLYEKRCSTK